MTAGKSPLPGLTLEAGPIPEGVDELDYLIATVPPSELATAAQQLQLDGIAEIVRTDSDSLGQLTPSLYPVTTLEDEIVIRQRELAGPKRRLATLIAALAAGACAFTINYNIDNQTAVSSQQLHLADRARSEANSGAVETAGILGGMCGAFGAVAVNLICYERSAKMARRPAQRLVKRTQSPQ